MTSSTKILLDLIEQGDPARISATGWHHYKCPFCPDTSAHLGINMDTGAVKCLRCNFSTRMKLSTRVPEKKKFPVSEYVSLFSTEVRNPALDGAIRLYMEKRNILSQCGWGFGRGNMAGKVAFPAYDQDGVVRYCQWRGTGDSERYMSMHGSTPRLDYWPFQLSGPGILILTEGPIDAHRIRSSFSMWASPLYGVGRKERIFEDIAKGYAQGAILRVVVLFDGDEAGHLMVGSTVHTLKYVYGVNKIAGGTVVEGSDPASVAEEHLVNMITKLMEESEEKR